MYPPMFTPTPNLALLTTLGLVGALLGSFIATAVERWGTGKPIAMGRSQCDHCDRVLTPFELIPMVSAAVLRFRCRTCRRPISHVHLQIEITACLVGILAGLSTSATMAVAGALFGWQLLALGAMDLRHFILPNGLTTSLAASGIATSAAGIGASPVDSLAGGIVGFGSLWLVKHSYRLLRDRDGLGGGDPKLFGAIGCWLGWQALPQVLLGASLIGLLMAAIVFRNARGPLSSRRLPFGTCLAVASFAAWFAPPITGF